VPKAYDDLVERLKQHPEVKNPYALAHSIQAHRERARIAKRAHDQQQEEKANGE